jgi:hypothetical protein
MGHVLSSVVTADMIWSLGLLVSALLSHRIAPPDLLRASAALWISNILVFASWYWRRDAVRQQSRYQQAKRPDHVSRHDGGQHMPHNRVKTMESATPRPCCGNEQHSHDSDQQPTGSWRKGLWKSEE